MPTLEWVPLTFGGLNTFDQTDQLPEGDVPVLENFEWLPEGGLVPRPGWRAAGSSPTGQPASMRSRGIYTDWWESGTRKIVQAFFDNTASFTFYKTNVANPTSFGSYAAIETGVAVTAAYRPDPVDFAAGASILMYTQPGFPTGRLRVYNGSVVTALSVDGVTGDSLDNIAGRCLNYHLNRFWVGGSPTYPTYLRFSEIGDYDAWNVQENYIPVAQDDGEPIEAICVWDRGQIIAKRHSMWFLSGYTVDSFQLSPISKKIGVARGPRSLIPSPFGVFVLGVEGMVYLYDGAELQPITEKTFVGSYAGDGSGYMSGAYVGDKLFVVATGAGQTIHSFQRGRWRKETISVATDCAQDLESYDDRYLLMTSANGTRALSVRQEIGARATSTYRTPEHDTGISQTYEARTKELWVKGAFGKCDLRHLYIRYRQWTGGTGELLTLTPIVDGAEVSSQAKTVGNKASAGVYAERLDFAATVSGRNVAVKISSAPAAGEAQTYSIEELTAGVMMDEGRR